MQSKLRFFSVIFSFVLLFSFVKISEGKEVKCFVLSSPEQMLVGVKRIAILDFEYLGATVNIEGGEKKDKEERLLDALLGEKKDTQKEAVENIGRKASDYIIAALLEKDRGIHEVSSGFFGLGKSEGKSYQKGFTTDFYSIAERSKIDQVMQEQAFGMSGAVNQDQAANIGEILGVDAVIAGSVEIIANENKYQQERKKKSKKYFVDCTKRQARTKMTMRIIGVQTGEILGQKNVENMMEDDKCEDAWGELASLDALAEGSMKESAGALVDYFAPHFVLQKIELKDVKADKYKNQAKKAIKHIEDEEFKEAFAIYTWIIEQDPYNHEALYMRGVLYEIASNYPEAYGNYEMAYTIKDDEKDYKEALDRVENQQLLWEKLNEIGIDLEVQDLSVSKRDMEKVSAKKIKLRGDSEDRLSIFAEPNADSEVIMMVPGGIKLELISQEEGFYKVKLITGEEGYLQEKDVD